MACALGRFGPEGDPVRVRVVAVGGRVGDLGVCRPDAAGV
jgi:hypothetical protein